ncbi:MAG: NADH-quinone oxidoreductase subunit NuoE [Dethiobacter sp.]|jgi:NADH-quinone oxidoreductase subunit E|nr:MAG: NADH-quinone oxidoreductase subunit NuoE [Dethiobacter sp.]
MAKSGTLEVGAIPYDVFDTVIAKYNGDPTAIISILQDIQEHLDYVPKDGISYLAEKLGVSPAKIYGIVTFYAQFRLQPKGKYIIMLCEGTACHVNGAKMVGKAIEEELNIKGGETTGDGNFTLEKVACIGCCSLSPVMVINEETYAKLTPESTRKILKEYQEREAAAQN